MKRRDFFRLTGLTLAAAGGLLASPAMAERQFDFFNSVFGGRRAYAYRGKQQVPYDGPEQPGTIIIRTDQRSLYYILPGRQALRYGVGVGREGFEWSGVAMVGRKETWPDWHPPKEMIARELAQYGRRLPDVMPGGPDNPLGARALYLYANGQDTMYRIHGTNAPDTIGQAMSSGCIRMLNEEVIDLWERTPIGAKVIVM